MPARIERERCSIAFYHNGCLCRITEVGDTSQIDILVEIPHTGFGPWDEDRQRRWTRSDFDPNMFLTLEEIEISKKFQYLFRPSEQSSVFNWQDDELRLVEYKDARGKRVQVKASIPHTGFGPWDSERRLEWTDTYYNPKQFDNLGVHWQKFVTNDAGRERF